MKYNMKFFDMQILQHKIYFFIINSLTKMNAKSNSISVVKRDDITKNTYIKLYSILNDIQDEPQ